MCLCANYNDVLVTLLGDVASNYVQIRTLEQRIELVRANVDLQDRILGIAEKYRQAGRKNALDTHQARSNLEKPKPRFRNCESPCGQRAIGFASCWARRLAILNWNSATLRFLSSLPGVVVIGIPAELLTRRPDVRRWRNTRPSRRANKSASLKPRCTQCSPSTAPSGTRLSCSGSCGSSAAMTGNIGPTFQWNILNYNRIRNNVRGRTPGSSG